MALKFNTRKHLERAQPASRQKKHGLLEKKKDYLLRARNFQLKRKRTIALTHKARMKNPDEFYFGMINAQVKDRVHTKIKNENQVHLPEELKLLKTQDKSYVRYALSIEQNKIQKLKESVNVIGIDPQQLIMESESEEEPEDSSEKKILDEDMLFFDSIRKEKSMKKSSIQNPKFQKHVVFVDEDVDPKEESLVRSQTNVDKNSTLTAQLKISPKVRELSQRLDRVDGLKSVEQEMFIQSKLQNEKGKRSIVGKDLKGRNIYKWRGDRKK